MSPAGEMMVNYDHISTTVMARDKALFEGHPIAAVCATNNTIAKKALKAIKVEYEVLPHVIDVLDAMKPDAPRTTRRSKFTSLAGHRAGGATRAEPQDPAAAARALAEAAPPCDRCGRDVRPHGWLFTYHLPSSDEPPARMGHDGALRRPESLARPRRGCRCLECGPGSLLESITYGDHRGASRNVELIDRTSVHLSAPTLEGGWIGPPRRVLGRLARA